jgi:hypothetical protein
MPFYNWTEMDRSVISPQYSTAEGPTIKGGQIEAGVTTSLLELAPSRTNTPRSK